MYLPLLVHYSALQTQSALLEHISHLDLEQENIPAPGIQARQALDSLMAPGREINHEIWTDSISTGKLTAGADACFARHDMM
ncbi:hypothetical protein HmCmsJML095_03460 [Escherichia coli]|uniref:hypothetical protein n=1 Tax=Escherichia coli TaxID=562 RepID=UPI0010CC3921|nr:hypothetical protein [Escherichia coli]GCP51083.1 hypothetical protein ExPECSC017_02770 [Escherichia coli]GCY69517.1 hypothetical protein HmCmsJML095_03460 [Escherichia coli]HDS6269112.1 hypothetical protein [Escherichia coli]